MKVRQAHVASIQIDGRQTIGIALIEEEAFAQPIVNGALDEQPGQFGALLKNGIDGYGERR